MPAAKQSQSQASQPCGMPGTEFGISTLPSIFAFSGVKETFLRKPMKAKLHKWKVWSQKA